MRTALYSGPGITDVVYPASGSTGAALFMTFTFQWCNTACGVYHSGPRMFRVVWSSMCVEHLPITLSVSFFCIFVTLCTGLMCLHFNVARTCYMVHYFPPIYLIFFSSLASFLTNVAPALRDICFLSMPGVTPPAKYSLGILNSTRAWCHEFCVGSS